MAEQETPPTTNTWVILFPVGVSGQNISANVETMNKAVKSALAGKLLNRKTQVLPKGKTFEDSSANVSGGFGHASYHSNEFALTLESRDPLSNDDLASVQSILEVMYENTIGQAREIARSRNGARSPIVENVHADVLTISGYLNLYAPTMTMQQGM